MAEPATEQPIALPRIGVVVVTYNSGDVIADCLDSVFASMGAEPVVVVVDNNSTDDSIAIIQSVIDTGARLTVVRSAVNGGYAYACNLGLQALSIHEDLDDFWILNPDCVVSPGMARAYLDMAREGPYSLMGSRTVYSEFPNRIQSDGGRFSRFSGACRSINNGCDATTAPFPDERTLDYISGANMVASRRFIDQAGPMPEDYFLYYEEVDWAQRRGNLPLRLVRAAKVYHIGGTAIGSGDLSRLPSPFSVYFNFRNRLRFVRRYLPLGLPGAVAFNLAKVVQYALRGAQGQMIAALRATLALQPTAKVAALIKDETARDLAFRR